ncbi:hypothetical protein SAMN06295912_1352 [Sphingomonas laterariae]|uniref:Uncharacterized protein n=1 Tax=Edaphosphingomonas laterariae TaxID=861865 RepID=A0A239JHB8_9SPHN|nr:hypothetical protein [Sphingomonas laterariae]SNT05199.1 hypothetical protein SAMN06295912_1352 [Sphingomonas laterariae]
MSEHQSFTVDTTAYLRNLDREDRQQRCIAIHYQAAPVEHADGSKSISLRVPALIMSLYLGKPNEAAEKIARILNKHWDDEA